MTSPTHSDEVPPTLVPSNESDSPFGGRRLAVGGALVLGAALLLALAPADNKPPLVVREPQYASADALPVAPPEQVTVSPAPPPTVSAVVAAAPPPAVTPTPPATPAPPDRAAPPRATIIAGAFPAHSHFTIDGRSFRSGRVEVVPGRHVLSIVAPGFVQQMDTIRIRGGDTVRWKPELARAVAAVAPVPRPALAAAQSPAPPPARSAAHDESGCQTSVDQSDWDAAFAACSRAAAGGSVSARRNLGALYQHGHGVRRSDDSATQWYQLAAQANDAESMYQLGDAYEHGHGVKKDQSAALEWYGRAANRGSAAAQYALGQVYEKGHLGVAKDRGQALAWYRKAAAQHYKDADDHVRDLSR